MILTTTNHIQGYEITDYLGLVTGDSWYTISGSMLMETIFQDKSYKIAFSNARDSMVKEAERLNADAIIGIQETEACASTMAGMSAALTAKNSSITKVTLVGTAVRIDNGQSLQVKKEEQARKEAEYAARAEENRRQLAEELAAKAEERQQKDKEFEEALKSGAITVDSIKEYPELDKKILILMKCNPLTRYGFFDLCNALYELTGKNYDSSSISKALGIAAETGRIIKDGSRYRWNDSSN